MQVNNYNNTFFDKGKIDNVCTYNIGKGAYNVQRVFGQKSLKDILLEKISSESDVALENNSCYTAIES